MPTRLFSKRVSILFSAALLFAATAPRSNGAPDAADTNPTATTAKPVKTETKPVVVPSDEELRKRLTPLQYQVTRQNGTEHPFTNDYWQNHREGIYVDIITGEPLFSSKDKFDSECGWPAFSKPISDQEIKQLPDRSHGMERIEVRSKNSDAHLGHVFNDGPRETGGLRYCINSASLRFIPKEKMAEAGYGDWLKLFETKPSAAEKK